MEFIQNFRYACQEKYEDLREKAEENLFPEIKKIIVDRALLHGLPIAVICSVAGAYLFSVATPIAGAMFGAVNYLTFSIANEVIHHHFDMNHPVKIVVLSVLTGLITQAFLQVVCRMPLSYSGMAILTTAAMVGQLFRLFCV